MELSKDSLGIFPSMTREDKGFSVNLWADLDTNFNNPVPLPGREGEFKIQETDLTVSYANSFRRDHDQFFYGGIAFDCNNS